MSRDKWKGKEQKYKGTSGVGRDTVTGLRERQCRERGKYLAKLNGDILGGKKM